MMSRHFRMSSELSGAIAKKLMPKISFLRLAVSSINSLYIHIYTLTGQKYLHTTLFPHTNIAKLNLFMKEKVIKL